MNVKRSPRRCEKAAEAEASRGREGMQRRQRADASVVSVNQRQIDRREISGNLGNIAAIRDTVRQQCGFDFIAEKLAQQCGPRDQYERE